MILVNNKKLDEILVRNLGKASQDFFTIDSDDNFVDESFKSIKDWFQGRFALISDQKIWSTNLQYFKEKQGEYDLIILEDPKANQACLDDLCNKIKFYNLVIAFGSGTINDLCKLAAFQNNIPYVIFPSAASMNGYLSPNASIMIDGHKRTVPARAPAHVFCNISIIKSAPINLNRAGIGDIMCFYSCWFDWYLSHLILGTKFKEDAFLMLEDQMSFLVNNYQKFSLEDIDFTKLLIEILLVSGLSMMICKGSYPASQSEHLMAHIIEMKYPKINKLHGEMVAMTVIDSAKIQNDLLENFERNIDALSDKDYDENNIRLSLDKFFDDHNLTQQIIEEYRSKVNLIVGYKKKLNLPRAKSLLSGVYLSSDVLDKIFKHFDINCSANLIGLSDEEYLSCIHNAKFIRNRFTCLDLV